MIRYVHCCREECTHFCGRKTSLHKARGNPIDLSILSNPEPLKDESDREPNVRRYAAHLLDLCKRNPFIREILLEIPDDAVLGCFCHPRTCHCQVIIDARNYYKHEKDIPPN